jgi:hypothetical protein
MLTTDRKNQKQRLLPQRTRRITEEGKGLPRINMDQEEQNLPRRHGGTEKNKCSPLIGKTRSKDFYHRGHEGSRRKGKAYRGLTRINVDQEKTKPTTETRRKAKDGATKNVGFQNPLLSVLSVVGFLFSVFLCDPSCPLW